MKAMAIFDKAISIEGTPVEAYLRGYRHLDIPDRVSGRALRYHPACPWDEGTRPATERVRIVNTYISLGHRFADAEECQ
jgi:putative DNA primase/helicase